MWRDIADGKVTGRFVWLHSPVWRHPFPGKIIDPSIGRVWVDTCEPEAKGYEASAQFFMEIAPLPPEGRRDG